MIPVGPGAIKILFTLQVPIRAGTRRASGIQASTLTNGFRRLHALLLPLHCQEKRAAVCQKCGVSQTGVADPSLAMKAVVVVVVERNSSSDARASHSKTPGRAQFAIPFRT